jgi:hypothetical protein
MNEGSGINDIGTQDTCGAERVSATVLEGSGPVLHVQNTMQQLPATAYLSPPPMLGLSLRFTVGAH